MISWKNLKFSVLGSFFVCLCISASAQTNFGFGQRAYSVTGSDYWGETHFADTAPQNTLTFYDHASITSAYTTVGAEYLATSNSVYITEGSTWTIMGDLQLGTSNNTDNIIVVDGDGELVKQIQALSPHNNGFFIS